VGIQCIGATTLDEYRTNFERMGLLSVVSKIIVDAPSKAETLIIIQNVKFKYEEYHKVNYSDEILELCVNLADRYITDREFPDKAFDIIDEVGARSQVEIKLPESIEKLKGQAALIKEEKIFVVKNKTTNKRQSYETKSVKLSQN
jgi:ATPases with chaperone activity, ATP-binding subunit